MSEFCREEFCRQSADDKRTLGLPLSRVCQIDEYLRNEWNICPPLDPNEWNSELSRIAGKNIAKRFYDLHDSQAEYVRDGLPIPRNLETRFYDLIANPKISGLVHSQKRAFILDAAALLTHLAVKLQVTGPILDVGCHIGYHALWLAQELGVETQGIDFSKSAIAIAQQKTRQGVHASFDSIPLESDSLLERFELAYAVDSLELDAGTLLALSRALKPNGVAIIVSVAIEDFEINREHIAAAGFGFGMLDVIGGWLGEGRGFKSRPVLVLLKGRQDSLPEDIDEQVAAGWNYFRDYANTPSVPWDEKTQAFYRGKWIEQHT